MRRCLKLAMAWSSMKLGQDCERKCRPLESRLQAVCHMPRTGFDLYLNIVDGLPYHLPGGLRPSAWWAIDSAPRSP
jgi:hypothetical protein